MAFYRNYGKRWLDIAASLVSLVLLSPLILFIALLVRLKLGAPVLFRQPRPGYKGVPFSIMKFRSMNNARDSQGNLLPDAERLTTFGKFLRRSSLDELPELINILRGEMSLVGPRPLLMQYLELYSPEQMRRHDARPGLTGWAQVNGRNAISWSQRFELDVWYVDHISLGLDIKIILVTLMVALRGSGINQPGHATIEEFRGNF